MKLLKKHLFTVIIYIFLFEVIFQLLFIFDLKFIKQPILFYNGYCDQKYWNMIEKKNIFDANITKHSILSFKKKDIFIPEVFKTDPLIDDSNFSKTKISLYGSSYMNHTEVKNITKNFQDIKFTNYAFESYGLDQIFLNYKLTAHLNQNRTIIIFPISFQLTMIKNNS